LKEIKTMTSRKTKLLTFAAAAIFSLLAPSAANAQWGGRDRDRDDDYYGRRNGRLSDHERRQLRDLARRIDDRSASLQRNVDRALDNSRYDDTRREDRINSQVADFRRSAARFRDRAGDSNELNRSVGEARQLINDATRIERIISRARLDSRAHSDWSQIRSDLRAIANIYNIRTRDFDGGYYGRDDRDRRDNGRGLPWPNNWPRPF
jgi:hypothetical protein